MKNNPFPQAQMLDSRGVLHEGHGAVHNPAGNWFVLDNLLKSIAIRPVGRVANGSESSPRLGFVPIWRRWAAPCPSPALRARTNTPSRRRRSCQFGTDAGD